MSWQGDLLKAGIDSNGRDVSFYQGHVQLRGRSQSPGATAVQALLVDTNNDILLATGTTVPGDETGYAKGCLFIDTDVADGTPGLYENIGTNTSSDFNAIGAVAAGEITLAEGWVLVGNSSGVAAALDGGATGQFFVSNGTTMVSVAASGDVTLIASGAMTVADSIIRTVKVSLTNTQLKGLTTPFELVAAPAANHMLRFLGAVLELQAGSEVLAESADNLAIRYTDGAGVIVSQTIEMTGFIDQAANVITNAQPVIDAIVVPAGAQAQAIVLDNTSGDFTGNASNDATLDVYTTYVDVNMT